MGKISGQGQKKARLKGNRGPRKMVADRLDGVKFIAELPASFKGDVVLCKLLDGRLVAFSKDTPPHVHDGKGNFVPMEFNRGTS